MRSLQLWLEEIVQQEFGQPALAGIRAVAGERQSSKTAAARATAFIDAIADVRHRTGPQTYAMVGRGLVAILYREMPAGLNPVESTSAALLQVNQLGRAVVTALLPGIQAPQMDLELLDAVTMRLTFSGSSKIAALLEGVIHGLSAHFSEQLVVTPSVVLTAGEPRQRLDVRFTSERRSGTASPPTAGGERRSGALGGVTTVLR